MPQPDNTSSPVALPQLPRGGAALAPAAPPPLASLPLPGGEPPAGPPALSAAPSAATLWHSFRRRWAVAVLVALAGGAAAAAGAAALVPGVYTAEALIKATPHAPITELGEQPIDPKIFREDQAGIILSSPVLGGALSREDVVGSPAVRRVLTDKVEAVAWLKKGMNTDYKYGPSILRLSMQGEDPELVKALVNGVAAEFVRYSHEVERQKRLVAIERLEAHQQAVRQSLQEKVSFRNDLLRRLGIPSPEDTPRAVDQAMSELRVARTELLKLRLREQELAARLQQAEARAAGVDKEEVTDPMLDRHLRDDPILARYLKQLTLVEEEIRLYENGQRDNPVVRDQLLAKQQSRQGLVREINAYRRSQAPAVREEIRADLGRQIADSRAELETARLGTVQFAKVIEDLEAEAARLRNPPNVAELNARNEEIRSMTKSLDTLADRIAELKIAPSGFNINLLQAAETPHRLDRSRQIKYSAAAGLGVFAMLLLGVSLLEFRTRKINGVDEVVHGLGMGLVGTLPRLPPGARLPAGDVAKRDRRWQEALGESIDAVRTMLLHAARADGLQVVMVAGAGAGEGKTSLASQLAVSLARGWKKTLLVDGDLRNPAVHKLFGLAPEPGLSEVLRGEASAADAVQPTQVGRLWAMPAGHRDSHAVQALAQDGVGAVLAELKAQYDFIVVDSSPVLPVADALLLAQHVDAVVFAVLRDVSRAPSVHAARQKLASLGVRCLGAVVIGAGEAGGYPYPARGR